MSDHIPCKQCGYANAHIIEREHRKMVECLACGYSGYLKEYTLPPPAPNLPSFELQLSFNF